MFTAAMLDLDGEARARAFEEIWNSNEFILREVLDAEDEIRQLELKKAEHLSELDRRGVTDRRRGLKTPGYIAHTAGVDAGRVRRDLKVGQVLRLLPAFRDAVDAGTVSIDHARAVAQAYNPRVAPGLVELQPVLIERAAQVGFKQWTRELRGMVELLDQDGGHDPNRDVARNSLSVTKTFDGLLHLAGTLFGDDAEAARIALEAKADELFLRFTKDHKLTPDIQIPPRNTLLGLAFIELCIAGGAVDHASTKPPRPEVTMVITADAPTEVHDPFGIRLPDGTTWRTSCDPDIIAIVVDGLGVPLAMGRRTRLATTAQRHAMAVRDGGCVFAGCDCPVTWTEAHHLDPWQFGGDTDVDKMASLCRHHHGVTHRTGWTMHATPDGWFWWRTPNGDTFWSQRHGQQRDGPVPDG